jgi:regulator of sigma E protease
MIVFAAGAFFNVLFAFTLATILWIVGQPTSEELSSTRLGYIAKTMVLSDGTTVPSPASEAGLQIGDTIRAIDGRKIADWPDMMQTLVTSAGITDDGRRKAVFSIEREGQLIDIPVYPRLSGEDGIRKVGIIAGYTPIVASVPAGSFAAQVGLAEGDRLIALDGVQLLNLITMLDVLQEKPARAFTLTIDRNGARQDLTIPAARPADALPLLGAGFRTNFGLKYTNPFEQIATHVTTTFRTLWSLIHPNSDIGISKLSGPIGIGKIYWDASEAGIRYVLWIAILVNINLAIFNLLPIPVLDGGHMFFATIGKLRGRPLPMNFIATAQSIFIVLLFSMIIYVSVFDVRRIARDVSGSAPAASEAPTETKKAEPAQP